MRWELRIATASGKPAPWDAEDGVQLAAAELEAEGWRILEPPSLVNGRWRFRAATWEGHNLTADMTDEEGILRLTAETPWYPPPDDSDLLDDDESVDE